MKTRTAPADRSAASERGVALITALMVMTLMSALMVGFAAVVGSDQRYRTIDRDRGQAFYAAHSGLEKLNAELATIFFTNVAPPAAEVAALAEHPPTIPGATFITEGRRAYGITIEPQPANPQPTTISSGPYAGLYALKRQYTLNSGVVMPGRGEAFLRRRVETVAIPVFQFGMFSHVDLSFSAADDFDFGGRVHTNGNLFLSQGGDSSSTLWLRDRVTAVGQVVRQRLSNGVSIDTSGSTRTVRVATTTGATRALARTEGSVVDGETSALNSSWPTISLSTYNAYLRNGRTGARVLSLPLLTTGGLNEDLVKRARPSEDTQNPTLLGERYFSKVSLRILLSDTAADITNLPTVTPAAPVSLESWAAGAPAGYVVGAGRPPVALSRGPVPTTTIQGTGSNMSQLTVASTTPFLPTLTINGATVTCAAKDSATAFSGCVGVPDAPAGTLVTGDPGRVTTLTAALTSGATVVSVASTAPFVPRPFWVGAELVTCTGWTNLSGPRFTSCAGYSQEPVAGTPLVTHHLTPAGTGLIGGFIKIELQDANRIWHDVTMEILNHGIAGVNLGGSACADPTPNAIVRLQRLRDNGGGTPTTNGGGCHYVNSINAEDYWPNVLFDAREAVFRDTSVGAGNLRLGGVIHYVALDVANLSRWFQGTGAYVGSRGPTAISDNGFSVYLSDRRNNRDAASRETGEYGFEDFVNPGTAAGTPNGALDKGEDLNDNKVLDVYGQFPSANGVYNSVINGSVAPLNVAARPWLPITPGQARVNRPIFFRRALKIINGSLGNIVAPGLTIAAENPVYLQGDWNADQNGFGAGVATSVVADAVTLLSNAWNDRNSFNSPYDTDGRPGSARTYYRLAIIAGKGRIFPRPSNGEGATYGTDGGVHSFLRFLEGGAAREVWYRGSMATFFYNRQAVSPFKCCGGVVYDVPVRRYDFDINFLNPALLPPLTPVFRDVNALGFWQDTRLSDD